MGIVKTAKLIYDYIRYDENEKEETFRAIDGVDLEVEPGQFIAVLGHNGSGKSTILKIITGVLNPTSGNIIINGRISALLELGAGFNMEYTGIENIYLNGTMIGFSKEEIDSKLKDILDFADIGDFINKPVKTYSSGMYSKLAFAITAILETDIMLIDEVLSVGDVKFKEKSYNKMKELISDEHRTVIIVSHSLGTIKELCNEVLWLNDGKVMMIGKPEDVIPKYEEFMRQN